MGSKEKSQRIGMTITDSAIMQETVHKELRHQKLYTNYTVNPFKKMYTLTEKPNRAVEGGTEDIHFVEVIKRAHLEPTKKFTAPQTESQEIGWITQPLIELDRSDRRLYFPKNSSEITRYMGEFWRAKEASKNNAKDK